MPQSPTREHVIREDWHLPVKLQLQSCRRSSRSCCVPHGNCIVGDVNHIHWAFFTGDKVTGRATFSWIGLFCSFIETNIKRFLILKKMHTYRMHPHWLRCQSRRMNDVVKNYVRGWGLHWLERQFASLFSLRSSVLSSVLEERKTQKPFFIKVEFHSWNPR